MKIGDKVWVPVEVVETEDNGTAMVQYSCGKDDSFWVYNSDVQTVTTEDYRNALSEFYKMGSMERVKIWGFGFVGSALDTSAEEFVGRLRKCRNEPKTGQIWETSTTGKKIVILGADKNEVRYFMPSGCQTWSERDYFENNFCNTGEVLASIGAFLKDLEGLNEG